MVVGISIGVLVILLILFLVSLVLLLKTRRKASQKKREEKGLPSNLNLMLLFQLDYNQTSSTKHSFPHQAFLDALIVNLDTHFFGVEI